MTAASKKEKIDIHLYPTARSCLKAFFCGEAPEKVGKFTGYEVDGTRYRMSGKKFLATIKKHRTCWGFCRKKTEIHVWVSKRAKLVDVVALIAHERGHTLRPYYPHRKEEMKAGRYEDMASFALTVAVDLINRKRTRDREERKVEGTNVP